MKNYERPIVMINEDLAEGVYAASGAEVVPGDPQATPEPICWTIWTEVGNRVDSDGYTNFRVKGTHNGTLHISNGLKVTVPFTGTVSSPICDGGEFTAVANGSSIVITRNEHANAEGSPDNFDVNLAVTCDASTMPIDEAIIWSCSKEVSVNGGWD